MGTNASTFLSLVLRHEPARIGITVDGAGWTDVDALLAACAAHGVPLTRAELEAIVATSDKQRFALSADGARRGRPVVLVVRAAEMAAAGHVFFKSDNGVWLVDHVPVEFLELPAPADKR